MTEHALTILSRRYPQLLLPVRNGEKDTDEYKNAVLRGEKVNASLNFSLNEKDSLSTVSTPAGDAEVLFLYDRTDFEHCIKCLAYRCEDKPVPPSMGATTLSGLINWEKLRPHMESDEEFARFTSDKSNYLDTIIILSSGPYSAVSAADMNLTDDEWTEKSIVIRKYHELTHFISGRLFPDNKEALRDEIVADMAGIVSAFGFYDTDAARRFLGIEGETYREGGRLQNYVEEGKLEDAILRAGTLIDLFSQYLNKNGKCHIFETVQTIESEKIGL